MYYLLYAILYIFSLLPLGVLYFLSDGFYVLVYYVLGYRKKVVMQNLQIAFPEKTEAERVKIARDFYHRFIDSMIETIKLLSAPDSFFEKRFAGNWHEVNRHYDSGRSVQLTLGHNFNWEWGNQMLAAKIRYRFLGVYLPISNKAVDKIFLQMRSRSGNVLINAHRLTREILPYRKKQYCLGLIADQNPATHLSKAYWLDFFGRKTPFTSGPAKNAIANNNIVVFATIERPKRGYYEVTFTTAEENPTSRTGLALTQQFVCYMEQTIKANPAMWLWSHRRWKHQWKGEE